jgi:hypothetical protein
VQGGVRNIIFVPLSRRGGFEVNGKAIEIWQVNQHREGVVGASRLGYGCVRDKVRWRFCELLIQYELPAWM